MSELNLSQELSRLFGFSSFKGQQETIIRNVLAGNDSFVLMPTGGGKSMCYQMPALLLEGTAIVVSPLIALMKNQVDAIRQVSQDDAIAHFLNSSLTRQEAEDVKEDVRLGRTKLLYVAPESLCKSENVEFLRSVRISLYAIDEAHCISEWGHDFRPEYRRIRNVIQHLNSAPVIALTATATERVRQDIVSNLALEKAQVFLSSFNRENLYYEVRPKTQDVERDIVKFIHQHQGKSGIIYCLSRKKVEELAEFLRVNNIRARAYHAKLEAQERSEAQDDFLMERIDVIVATIAFGMGIDKPDVRYVIHYDIPKSVEGYYQETGRAGRDGGEGRCITFYKRRDLRKLEKFIEGKPQAEHEAGKQLLAEMGAYAEGKECRRRMILRYFGEEYTQANCHNCDLCLHPERIGLHDFSHLDLDEQEPETAVLDDALFKMLKKLRREVAQKKQVPPYVVFQDPSLEAMAIYYPMTIDELRTMPGVGEGKAKRYGAEFVEMIGQYCIENDIDRPDNLRIRNLPTKADNKVSIIQKIDRRLPLPDIADALGKEFDQLLTEIEAIVNSGTRLNIDYYLEEIMDDEDITEIMAYLRRQRTDSMKNVYAYFTPDFTEEELRMVRIKFISEMAN